MRYLKKCPECGEFPRAKYIQHLLYNEARIFCPSCLRTTDWHSAIFASDALRKAEAEWQESIEEESNESMDL